MLDVFLEVVSEKTKQANADARRLELLERLPLEDLQKIAEGTAFLKEGMYHEIGSGCWLDKFKGTPLLDEAIAIEREELEIQMQETERQRALKDLEDQFGSYNETNVHRDELSIRRRLLDLELAGADTNNPEDADLEEEEEGAEPVAAAAAAAPVEEKPPAEEKIDVKAASANMRLALVAHRIKEAQPANRAGSFHK